MACRWKRGGPEFSGARGFPQCQRKMAMNSKLSIPLVFIVIFLGLLVGGVICDIGWEENEYLVFKNFVPLQFNNDPHDLRTYYQSIPPIRHGMYMLIAYYPCLWSIELLLVVVGLDIIRRQPCSVLYVVWYLVISIAFWAGCVFFCLWVNYRVYGWIPRSFDPF